MGTKLATDKMLDYTRRLWNERDLDADYLFGKTFRQQFNEVYLDALKLDNPPFTLVSNAIDLLRMAPYKGDEAGAAGDWYGQIGHKGTITGKLIQVRTMNKSDRQFILVKIRNESGNIFTFFVGKFLYLDCDEDDANPTITVEGRIKDHSVYRGQKQTMLTHVHVL